MSARHDNLTLQSVDAEWRDDPFGKFASDLRKLDADQTAAFDSFMTASRDAREAFDNAMRELRNV